MLSIIVGLFVSFVGILQITKGTIGYGLLVLFCGITDIIIGTVKMLRTYNDGLPFFNGLKSKGQQQAEDKNVLQYENGDQPANIWDEMTKEDK